MARLWALILLVASIATVEAKLDIAGGDGMVLEDASVRKDTLDSERQNLLEKLQAVESDNKNLRMENQELKREFSWSDRGLNNTSNIYPADCTEVMSLMGKKISGVYTIYPFNCGCKRSIKVYCDMVTDGGGWTVILRRITKMSAAVSRNYVNFNQSWAVYREGFGSPFGEHWMGNENLNVLTNSKHFGLRMTTTDTNKDTSHVFYDNIEVAEESEGYALKLGSYQSSQSTLGTSCLAYSNYKQFSTYDRDSDSSSANCAGKIGGGFWYYNCQYYALLNSPTRPHGSSYLPLSCYFNKNYKVTELKLMVRALPCEKTYKQIKVGCNGDTC